LNTFTPAFADKA